ncbi:thymidylate synthase family protein [Saccharothrix hoggarensis]|uniref:Uncharacterized protein n=1 Tax=Saccharothrix hoggarensis TaxID=913853 RepID=A0ABW3QID3_9PSEU
MHLSDSMITGTDCGQAWLSAVQTVLRVPGRKALHLVVRITHPDREDPRIRHVVDDLLRRRGLQPVDTVVNTLFPRHLARLAADPAELAARYRTHYPRLRKLHRANGRGTYFGRLVAHPADGREVDQLARIVARLRSHARKPGAAPLYEAGFMLMDDDPEQPGHSAHIDPGTMDAASSDEPVDATSDTRPATTSETADPASAADGAAVAMIDTPIYAPRTDAMPLGFPCLSHVSFQAVGNTVHALAQYRSQYLVERGYGNYLSLGLLLRYVADAAGLQVGALTVTTGLAAVDGGVRQLTTALQSLTQQRLPGL